MELKKSVDCLNFDYEIAVNKNYELSNTNG